MFYFFQVLKSLNSNTRNPYLIWDNSTRLELLDYLNEQQKKQMKYGLSAVDPSFGAQFMYTIHKKELIVGNIFVRVYNEQPLFTIQVSEYFFCCREEQTIVFNKKYIFSKKLNLIFRIIFISYNLLLLLYAILVVFVRCLKKLINFIFPVFCWLKNNLIPSIEKKKYFNFEKKKSKTQFDQFHTKICLNTWIYYTWI